MSSAARSPCPILPPKFRYAPRNGNFSSFHELNDLKVFSFATGVSMADRKLLTDAITTLGDSVVVQDAVDESASKLRNPFRQPLNPTHIVVDIPTRSEKFLKGENGIVSHSIIYGTINNLKNERAFMPRSVG